MADETQAEYTDDRLYRAVVKRITILCEQEDDPDPKILEIGGRLIKDASIKPLDLSGLADNDPAAKTAARLAAEKKKS